MSDPFQRVQPPSLLPAEPAAADAVFDSVEVERLRNVGMAAPDLATADVKPMRRKRRMAGPLALIALLALIGVSAAGAWRYRDRIRQFADAQIAAKEIAPLGDQPSDAVLRNLEAMRQELSQMSAAQSQLDQRLTAIEARASTAETSHGIPPGGSGWLDEPNALAFVTSTLHSPVAATPSARPSLARPATVGAGAPAPRPRPRPVPRPADAAAPTPAPPPTAAPRSGPVPPEPVPGQ